MKELEQIAARAFRLADLANQRKDGHTNVPRMEALTELAHAALRLKSIQEHTREKL